MNSKIFCIANWKMCMNDTDTLKFLETFNTFVFGNNNKTIVICPSYTSIGTVYNNSNNNFKVGAQNISLFKKGAYTGEISLNMLNDLHCSHIIIGHSEQRKNFKENDLSIRNKLRLIDKSTMTPIVCIGESFEERKNNRAFEIIEKQIISIFENNELNANKDLIIAYEPIWAIGTGLSADNKIISDMHKFIKNIIKNIYENYCNIYLLYGGSVNNNNAKDISNLNNVDGFLIGSSSLDPKIFYEIYEQL